MPRVLIKVINIYRTPVDFSVTASLKVTRPNQADVPLTRLAPGQYAGNLPDTDQSITASAESSEYWVNETVVDIHPIPGSRRMATTVSGVGKIVDIDTSVSPITLTITLVLQKVANFRNSMGISFGSPQTVMDFSSPILNPGGSGTTLFNQAPTPAALLQNNLYMMKWKSSGTFVGVYVPQAGTIGNYNVFFKPPRHGGWTTPGVTGLYLTWTGNREHKCLIAQAELSKSSYILCFAFEEDGPMPAYGQHQAGLMELLDEIDYFLRLVFKGSADRPDVRNVALSCFSAGAERVKAVCAGRGTALLSKLKGLFILDGNDFDISRLIGAGDRAIRIYVAARKFNSALQSAGTTVQGPNGSFEFRSGASLPSGNPAVIYLYVPEAFWRAYDPSFSDWMSIHQRIPGYFQSHALKTCGI
ncbi:MAG TPA: hypothetical protein VFO39_05885 [Candidatus Sulfotelmatobacter sp.]|nr:hypothetical protein [Candidatus Sulfotelmatobacter sp.]